MIEGARGDDVWRRAGVDSGVALISRHCVTAIAAADQQEAEKSSFIDPYPPTFLALSLVLIQSKQVIIARTAATPN